MSDKPDTLQIAEMGERDLAAFMKLKEAEGWNQTEMDLQYLLVNNPGLCLGAYEAGRLIGTVIACNYNDEVGWVGMMLVDRLARGRGVARCLLQHIFEKLHSTSSIKLDATPAGFPVYQKLGFNPEYEIQRMKNPCFNGFASQKAPEGIRLLEESDLPEIIEYDGKVFGTDRPAFIRHCFTSAPEQCWVAWNENGIEGFVLGRKGASFTQIGPVSAHSMKRARELISMALKGIGLGAAGLDVIADKAELRAWLEGLDFTLERPLFRMFLKSNDHPGQRPFQFAIGGPETG